MRPTSVSAHRSESWFAVQWPRTVLARLLCVVCLVALSGGSAVAQPSLTGKRVVVIKDKAPLAASGKEVAKASECTVFTVDKVDGEWLWIKSERAYLRRGDVVPFEDAIGHYTRLLEANKTANNYWNRAQIWRLKGELDIALGDMNDAIRLNSKEAAWFGNRGNLWADKNEYDKAIADYSEAIRLDPKNGGMYDIRGNAWSAKKDYDKAIADYYDALKYTDPNEKAQLLQQSEVAGGDSIPMVSAHAITLTSRGNIWCHKGDYDKAIADCEEAIRLDPKYESARHCRRNVWVAQKAWDKIITECDADLRSKPQSISLLNWRAWAWFGKDNFDKALADFEEVIRIDPKNDYALGMRRDCWGKKGEWDKVANDLNQAIKLPMPSPSVLNGLAYLRATCPDEKHRNGQQAVEYATKACELTAWKDANYLDTLAAAYAEAGNFAKAVEWQQKGMDLAPADQKADFESRLKLYRENKPFRQTAK